MFFLYKHSFRARGIDLERTLWMLSLDVVGVVASYAIMGTAKPGAKPSSLFTFGLGSLTDSCFCALSPEGNIWVSDRGHKQVKVFSAEGKFLFDVEDQLHERRIVAIVAHGVVIARAQEAALVVGIVGEVAAALAHVESVGENRREARERSFILAALAGRYHQIVYWP